MFQKHMFASVHNRTWMSQQNNKKTSSQDLSQVALQYKFQEPQKLQKKNENENWMASITSFELKIISDKLKIIYFQLCDIYIFYNIISFCFLNQLAEAKLSKKLKHFTMFQEFSILEE